MLVAEARRRLSRWTDLERVCEERLQRLPGDPIALRMLAEAALERGDHQRAEALYRRVIDSGIGLATDYNNLAWCAIVRGEATEQTLATARRAVDLGGPGTSIALHTLAAAAAEMGRTQEAREALVRSIDALPSGQPEANHWYVFARLAELYGEREIAAMLYRRVAPSVDGAPPVQSWELARKRLAAIEAEGPIATGGIDRTGRRP